MKDKIITAIRKHKLLLAFFAAALIKQILVISIPICAVLGTPCDDELMMDWAYSIAGFHWLGDFNAYTFAKEPGFAIFLAVCYRLHLPYIFTLTLGYSIACMVFCSALKNIFSSGKYVFVIYLLLLFHPVSFSSTVLQRVYRNGLGLILTLCVFGGLLHMYFSVKQGKMRQLRLWAVFTGLVLGYLWITKSDTIWLLPFTGTVCLIMFVMLLVKQRNKKRLFGSICLLFPFLGILLCSQGVKFLDMQWYGASSIAYYDAFMQDITHIQQGQENDKIPLTRKQLKKLYEVSPTLASVSGQLEAAMDSHNSYDSNPDDGEVEYGWFGWALIWGFSEAGVYEDCEKANAFYKNVYEELEAAFAAGMLEKQEETAAQKYYIDTPTHRRTLVGRIKETIGYMASYRGTRVRGISRKERASGVQAFEQLTRNKEVYYRQEYDFCLEGWIVFPEYDGKELEMYVEDKEGNQYRKLELKESGDVYDHLAAGGTILESAKNCRFSEKWNVHNDDWGGPVYLAVYLKEQEVARLLIKEDGFEEDESVSFISVIDNFSNRKAVEAMGHSSQKAAGRLNYIRSLYRANGNLMSWLGLLSYVILTVAVIWDLKNRKFSYMDPWLVSTGLGLSIIVFAAGIALVDLTECPAVNTMYLSSGYPILMAAELISLCKCLELAWKFVQERMK